MKTEFKMGSLEIKEAIVEYFARRGLEKTLLKDVELKATPLYYDRYENPVGSEISATVSVTLELDDTKIKS